VDTTCFVETIYIFSGVSYIGETCRVFSKRVKEHLRSDKASHIYKHIMIDEKCVDNSTENCFSILDTASTKYQLKIKEGLYIEWLKPELNRQVIHYSTTLK